VIVAGYAYRHDGLAAGVEDAQLLVCTYTWVDGRMVGWLTKKMSTHA
jgi:hypothetical protein